MVRIKRRFVPLFVVAAVSPNSAHDAAADVVWTWNSPAEKGPGLSWKIRSVRDPRRGGPVASFRDGPNGEGSLVDAPTSTMMVLPRRDFPAARSYWFNVDISEIRGTMCVGVAEPDEFESPLGIVGMFYDGGLRNENKRLVGGLKGPSLNDIGKGETRRCVLECRQSEGRGGNARLPTFSMTIYVDGICVGKAFEIKNRRLSDFLPCVVVDGRARFSARVLEREPDDLLRKEERHPLDGKWKIVQAERPGIITADHRHWGMEIWVREGGERFKPPSRGPKENDDDDPEGREDDDTPEISFSVKVVNYVSAWTTFRERKKKRSDDKNNKKGEVVVYDLNYRQTMEGHTTLIGGSPELLRIEEAIMDMMFETWGSIRYRPQEGEDTLEILDWSGSVVARCVRDTTPPGPTLTSY